MRKLAALLAIVGLAMPAFPARKTARAHTSTPKTSSSKKTASSSKKTASSSKKTASSKKSVSKKKGTSPRKTTSPPKKPTTSKKSRSPKRRVTRSKRTRQSWRTGQMAPTPERYREIQQALVAKGYASGPATGTWNTEWADSLKRFQQDQNLPPTGKITSLSLMALGLGPKRETAASTAVPAPAADDPATNREPQ